MSDSFGTTSPSGSDVYSPDVPGNAGANGNADGKVDAAKHEAADLKDTATTQAKDVVDTAKDEAASVVGEAKLQAKDLYAQTTRELGDQASAQQQRIATGLRSVGDELGSMAANSDGSGIAGDLVQQVSTKLSAAATWLGDREPGDVLTEVKRFARRRPGTFILAAALAGIVVGRLTRALATNAKEGKDAENGLGAASAESTAPRALTATSDADSTFQGSVPPVPPPPPTPATHAVTPTTPPGTVPSAAPVTPPITTSDTLSSVVPPTTIGDTTQGDPNQGDPLLGDTSRSDAWTPADDAELYGADASLPVYDQALGNRADQAGTDRGQEDGDDRPHTL